MTKKILIPVILMLLCLVSTSSFAAAEYFFEDEANTLHALKLIEGINKNQFTPDLGSYLTRAQGITLTLKLFGQKEAAEKLSDTEVNSIIDKFTDIKKTDWFVKYVAYSIKNNISAGYSSNDWMPNEQMQGRQLAKMILNELGYTNSKEYPYEKSLMLLHQINGFHVYNIVNYDDLSNKYLNRDNAVGILYSTLTAKMNSSNKSVIRYLVDNKIIQEENFVTTELLGDKQ